MTTYYVVPSASGSSDSNDGTAATTGGGHGPWLTLAHATATMLSGDTVYVQGGATFREVITIGTDNQTWIADTNGSRTGFAGDTIWTAYTTNDTSAPSGSILITNNNHNGTSFTGFFFIGGTNGTAGVLYGGASTVTGLSFTKCGIVSLGAAPAINVIEGVAAAGPTFDRCWLVGSSGSNNTLTIQLARNGSADYDCGMKITNCQFLKLAAGAAAVGVTQQGAGAFFGGGGLFAFNTVITGGSVIDTTGTQVSGIYPMICQGNYVLAGSGTTFAGGARGGIVEDWNICDSPANIRTNVGTGPNTIGLRGYAPLFEFWHNFISGRMTRPFMQPMTGAPHQSFVPLGLTIKASAAGTAADDSTVGTISWTNPTNALSPDGVNFATCVLTASAVGHYLKVTNCGFNLPSDATVTQIRVEYWADQTGSGQAAGNSIRLTKDGTTFIGNDNSAQITNLSASMVLYSVGGAADLWGTTWLYSDINASTFGVGLSFKNTNGASSITAQVDYLRIIVNYTRSSGNYPTEQTQDFTTGPRPANNVPGINLTAGALERGQTGVKDSSTFDSNPSSVRIDGPGYQDFVVAVDPAQTTLTAKLRWNSSYAGTNPQLQVLNGEECGVTQNTVTASGSANAWNSTSITFTPTSKGLVTIRFISNTTASAGSAWIDTAS